jgi:hypothetical protein
MRTVTSEQLYSENALLEPRDVADAVLYVLGCPEHVQVNATAILFLGFSFYVFPGSLYTWMYYPEFISKCFTFDIRVRIPAQSQILSILIGGILSMRMMIINIFASG